MSDEELGRRWCERTGRRPEPQDRDQDEPHHPCYRWWPGDMPWVGAAGLPEPLWPAVNGYSTEAAAYAAVGAALRRVWAFAEQSKLDLV